LTLLADGRQLQVSWTAPGVNNAWLMLDRNGNGRVDNGAELFGNVTPQPAPPAGLVKNGFNALAVYDQPANGGNGDGWIDENDAVYSKLRVWLDKNHDGISDPSEIFTFKQVGIKAISLTYEKSKWVDANGNQFRFRGSIIRDTPGDGQDHGNGQVIYDVILKTVK
jgi:hypothetical protein